MTTDPRSNTPQKEDWDKVAHHPEFEDLMAAKARFIVPATLFFIVFYFALPVLVGYAPELMSKPVLGPLNWAYLFALSQFIMTWALAFLYLRAAGRFDATAKRVLDHISRQKDATNGGQE